MSRWEEDYGREYRAAHKREHYEAINVQFLKDAPDGLTKKRVQQAAAERGLPVATYIKNLIRADLKMGKEQDE